MVTYKTDIQDEFATERAILAKMLQIICQKNDSMTPAQKVSYIGRIYGMYYEDQLESGELKI